MIKKQKKEVIRFAFTLAEVLITLGVIGIVAAMTIPTLVQSYKKKVASTRIKKFYSTISQVVKMSEVDNGAVETWNFVSGAGIDKEGTLIDKYADTYIFPYFKGITKGELINLNEIDTARNYFLNDGSSFTIHAGNCVDIIYDYNGKAEPNILAKDQFDFLICHTDEYLHRYSKSNNFGVIPYCLTLYSKNRNEALSLCRDNPQYCSCLLMYDGWEFKKDYPFKL